MIQLPDNEKIIVVIRKHWFLILLRFISLLFIGLLPLIVMLFTSTFTAIEPGSSTQLLLWIVYLIWLLFTWLSFYIYWTDYVLDVWIVTNKRVIDIEQVGMFRRETSSVRLENIQDVTCNIHGIIQTALHYGELSLQTSGTEKEFVLKYATKARRAKEIIMKLHDEILEQHKTLKISQENLEELKNVVDRDPFTSDLGQKFPAHPDHF